MNHAEVLAPAGNTEALYAAVRCGADAVYLGMGAFNARRNAVNFSEKELSDAIRYCHARNVKVYITLNTLVSDGELKTASEVIECACRLSADALILQDIGLAAVAKRIAPEMPLHASTQMSVQSTQGVKLLEKAGFSRVVLARELSLDEIIKIKKETSAELEVFVHGALCMCVSGQCLLSAMLGSRSGNRGLCAQPCRLPFGVNGSRGFALSLKDMSVISKLSQLENAGVASFKIEGRMKRPEYVAAAVTACRKSLDGELSAELCNDLQSVFSRSGFTSGYLDGQRGPHMFGTRRKEDVEGAAPVLKKLEHLYDKEHASVPVNFALTCVRDEPLSLSASANGKNVFVCSDVVPEPAINRALDEASLKDRISKCGGTQFYAADIYIELDDGLSAPASAFNALRRDALERLDAVLSQTSEKKCIEYNNRFTRYMAKDRKLFVRVFKESQLPSSLKGIDRLILPLGVSADTIGQIKSQGIQTAVEIPRAFFSNEEKYKVLLEKAKQNGVEYAVASTLDGLQLAIDSGLKISSGFGMNVFNTEAVGCLENLKVKDILVSPELTLRQISSLGGNICRGVLAYGRLPLMLTRNCPISTKNSCKECGGRSHLTDRMGVEFPVICSNGCSELLNSRPVYLADRLDEIKNVDFIELFFTNESREECENIISAYLNQETPHDEFTRGLYYRGVE